LYCPVSDHQAGIQSLLQVQSKEKSLSFEIELSDDEAVLCIGFAKAGQQQFIAFRDGPMMLRVRRSVYPADIFQGRCACRSGIFRSTSGGED